MVPIFDLQHMGRVFFEGTPFVGGSRGGFAKTQTHPNRNRLSFGFPQIPTTNRKGAPPL